MLGNVFRPALYLIVFRCMKLNRLLLPRPKLTHYYNGSSLGQMIPIPFWIKFLINFAKDKLLDLPYFRVIFEEIIVIWSFLWDLGEDLCQIFLVVFFQFDLI